jgi:transcriptional regulator of acetoin/glycerol metabolism
LLRTLTALAGPNGFVGMQDLPPAIRSRQQAPSVANLSPTGSSFVNVSTGVPSAAPGSGTLAGITDQAIRAAIEASDGNVAAAARKLGVSRSTLYRHMS